MGDLITLPIWFTIRQAAAKIKVCRNTMRVMIDDGRVVAMNIARPGAIKPVWRIKAESLRKLDPKAQEEKWKELEQEGRFDP
jgi:hypothetical protein